MWIFRRQVKPFHTFQLLAIASPSNLVRTDLSGIFPIQTCHISNHNYRCRYYTSPKFASDTALARHMRSSSVFQSTKNDSAPKPDQDIIQPDAGHKQHNFNAINPTYPHDHGDRYLSAIRDLNSLQSNKKTIALHKYNNPQDILPLFRKHLALAGVVLDELHSRKLIHISGTKGKGSTCTFIESILRSSGFKTGFYNSPHVLKVNERIRINGEPLADHLFARYFNQVYDKLKDGAVRENVSMPTYFAFLTILGFHVFIEEKVDCAIIEVGIGGQYDPTNVIMKPVACGITTLDYDHTDILGKTIESIAWSKAGICKPKVPLFTIQHDQPEASMVIESRAKDYQCPVTICKPLASESLKSIGIKGLAQLSNAALACQISKYFIDIHHDKELAEKFCANKREVTTDLTKLEKVFQDGLANCRLCGRCQVVDFPRVTFFLDGAHTSKSMENCLDWYKEASSKYPSAIKILLINIIGERDREAILRPLVRYAAFETVIFSTNRIKEPSCQEHLKMDVFLNTQVSNENFGKTLENNFNTWNALRAKLGSDNAKCLVIRNTEDSLRYISEMSASNKDTKYHVLVTGSLHFVGATLQTFGLVENLFI